MKEKIVWYDEEEDVLGIQIENGNYWKSVELPNGIIFDLSKEGKITSVEILKASKIFTDDAQKVIDLAKKNKIPA